MIELLIVCGWVGGDQNHIVAHRVSADYYYYYYYLLTTIEYLYFN